jgi:hypothetical protein
MIEATVPPWSRSGHVLHDCVEALEDPGRAPAGALGLQFGLAQMIAELSRVNPDAGSRSGRFSGR